MTGMNGLNSEWRNCMLLPPPARCCWRWAPARRHVPRKKTEGLHSLRPARTPPVSRVGAHHSEAKRRLHLKTRALLVVVDARRPRYLQDRLGTNIGKTPKKTVFLQATKSQATKSRTKMKRMVSLRSRSLQL